mgnify:CR=1 FL=1
MFKKKRVIKLIELNNNNTKKILMIVAFAILLYWGLQNLSIVGGVLGTFFKVILPFILGLCIAFVLNIPVRIIEKLYYSKNSKNKKANKKNNNISNDKKSVKINIALRVFSIVVSICVVIFILYFVLFLIIPELINTINIFKLNIPNFIENIKIWLIDITENYPDLKEKIVNISIDLNSIESTIKTIAKGGITTVITSSFNFIVSIFNGLFNFVMGLVFALYILLQKEKLIVQLKKIIIAYFSKEKVDSIFDFGRLANDTFSKFIAGQFIEACILGILCFIGMTFLGFPYAAAISVLIGVTALIPFFGAFIGVSVGAILIFAIDPIKSFWFIVYFLILQQVEGNLIYPKVVGDSVGLPAIWVILAVTVGGSLFGIIGMMIGVPFVSVLYKTLRKNVNKNLKKKELQKNQE